MGKNKKREEGGVNVKEKGRKGEKGRRRKTEGRRERMRKEISEDMDCGKEKKRRKWKEKGR